ncbi:CRISPR-associated protein Cas5 [Sulfuracidifex metallicus]|uniref:CRISPR-associated protein Cas5 n=1 Tax=Sulfuracidifex metallicus TaxID=47303 RepID=UPI002272C2FB|nr:CRISPR-associated protein Cas5 [Sulfuracidifex metallicus]MCY0850240.1 CRISPR-associated protein Cas5 [Sulfuracidifex metallicus]
MMALSFNLRGAMAHFRKVFTNSTSLSYYFPPRTTLMGIIAATMGMERDSYYSFMDKFDFAVNPITGLRKVMFGETYLDTDTISEKSLRRLKQGVPTGREFILPSGDDFLGYRVVISPSNDLIKENVEEIKKQIEKIENALKSPAFPIALGALNMLGWVEELMELECQEMEEIDGEVSSVIPSEMKPELRNMRIAIEELVPRRFDKGRHTGKLSSYLVEIDGGKLKVKGKVRGITCNGENFVFL